MSGHITDWRNPFETIVRLASNRPTEVDECELYRDLLQQPPEFLKPIARTVRTVVFYCGKLSGGGAERVVAEVSSRLAGRCNEQGMRYRVIVATDEPASAGDFALDESVIRVQLPPFAPYGGEGDYAPRAEALYRLIEEYEVDAFVDAMWNSRPLSWDLLCVKSHPSHPAFVIHCHGSASMLFKFKWLPERLFGPASLADGLVCLTPGDEWYWSQINPCVKVIPNPVDSPELPGNRISHGKTLLWVGRLSPEKRPEEAVKIFRHVHEAEPDAKLLFVGDANNKSYEQELREYVKKSNLDDCVFFEGFTRDVDSYYKQADVLLMTSEYEGFCLVLYEAALRGIPIVMYDLPYLLFCKRIDGWISVGQKDAEAAATEAVGLLRDEVSWQERSDRLVHTARAFASEDPIEEWEQLLCAIGSADAGKADFHSSAYWTLHGMARFHSENSNSLLSQVKQRDEEIGRIRSSHAFKVGMRITAPFRVIKKALSGKAATNSL